MTVQLRVKYPPTPEGEEWLTKHADGYAAAVTFVANFLENRSAMGDMTTREILAEFERNVCLYMRRDFDVLGTH